MDARPQVFLRLRGRAERRFGAQEVLLVSRHGDSTPDVMEAHRVLPGDYVAIEYGGAWKPEAAGLPTLAPRPLYGSEKRIDLPTSMTHDLAFFLGAYLSEGHTARTTWSVVITNSVLDVLERARSAAKAVFGFEGRIRQPATRCPHLVVSSKRLVEFMDLLGCGCRAADKRVPSVLMNGTREHVLTFLRGVALDAYTANQYAAKWGICLESREAIDGLQDLLTKLGIANAQIPKLNRTNGKTYYELYASGPWGQEMCRLVPFLEPGKAARAKEFMTRPYRTRSTDLIPGISGPELYAMVPAGTNGRNGRGTGRQALNHLCDSRTRRVTRASVERARDAGALLPAWLVDVLETPKRFVEVVASTDALEFKR